MIAITIIGFLALVYLQYQTWSMLQDIHTMKAQGYSEILQALKRSNTFADDTRTLLLPINQLFEEISPEIRAGIQEEREARESRQRRAS